MNRTIQDLYLFIIHFALCSKLHEKKALSYDNGPQSYNARTFYILNLLLINQAMTYEALFPLLALIRPDFDKYDRVKSLFRSFNSSFKVNGKTFSSCIKKKSQAYKGSHITVQLTRSGLELLKELNNCLDIPDLDPSKRLSNKDYDVLFDSFSKTKDGDHKLQNIALLTTLLALLGPIGITNFVTESLRNIAFVAKQDATKRSTYPDIQFYSSRDASGTHKVIIETDLGTEKIAGAKNSLVSKISETLSYGNISRIYGPDDPITQIYVECDSEYTVTRDNTEIKKLRKESVAIRDIVRSLDVIYDILMLEHGGDFNKDDFYNIMDRVFDNRTQYPIHRDTEELFKYMANIKRRYPTAYDAYEHLMDRKQHLKLAYFEKNNYAASDMEMQLAIYTEDHRIKLAKELKKIDYLKDRYRNGHSIFMIGKHSLSESLPYIFMNDFAVPMVRSIFSYIGEPSVDLSYRMTYSFIRISEREYGITLRNCFNNGKVIVAFEDISLDLTAIYRIAEYLSLPSSMLCNVMLCIIVDDDETLADGRKLKDSSYFKPDNWFGAESFDHSFLSAFNESIELPFMHRFTHDFFFIHRSDFMNMNMNGFIPMGKRCFTRKAKTHMSPYEFTLKFNKRDNYHGATELNTRWDTP